MDASSNDQMFKTFYAILQSMYRLTRVVQCPLWAAYSPMFHWGIPPPPACMPPSLSPCLYWDWSSLSSCLATMRMLSDSHETVHIAAARIRISRQNTKTAQREKYRGSSRTRITSCTSAHDHGPIGCLFGTGGMVIRRSRCFHRSCVQRTSCSTQCGDTW